MEWSLWLQHVFPPKQTVKRIHSPDLQIPFIVVDLFVFGFARPLLSPSPPVVLPLLSSLGDGFLAGATGSEGTSSRSAASILHTCCTLG